MKKILIYLDNVLYNHNNNEWDSFRAEGRVPINIGFGLSLLGCDVNILYDGWDLSNKIKKTWNNIQLSKHPIYNHYDIALSFSTFKILYDLKVDKIISIVHENSHISKTKEFIDKTGMNLQYACIYKNFLNDFKECIEGDVCYLPQLSPIPSINAGFLPCVYNPKLPELKLYLHYTSWPQNTTISGDRFIHKEQLIINYLKNKEYEIKLSILVENRETANKCPIKSDNITFYYSNECNYNDIINMICSADICITNGAPVFNGNSTLDIISLGKPLIYIGDGRIGVEWKSNFSNLLYNCPDNLIYIQESDNESTKKIEKIMNNPVDLCKKYANLYKDSDFNNWREIVKEIFDTGNL